MIYVTIEIDGGTHKILVEEKNYVGTTNTAEALEQLQIAVGKALMRAEGAIRR